jgi:hypothetical protein
VQHPPEWPPRCPLDRLVRQLGSPASHRAPPVLELAAELPNDHLRVAQRRPAPKPAAIVLIVLDPRPVVLL